MGLQRDRFTVYVQARQGSGEPGTFLAISEHEAVITHQDMLRGERAVLDGNGDKLDAQLQLVTAWCWASLMRQGDYAGAWQQFRDTDCQGVEKLEAVDVDPTNPTTTEPPP